MAYENIQITEPNFCLGPQIGTICTVDTSSPSTVLRIKNLAGAIIQELTFSSNIVNDVVGLEYVGPPKLNSLMNGLSFFTLERVNSSSCIIKRWETRVAFSVLDLKEQIVRSNSGDAYYDVPSFAVEYDTRTLRNPNENYSFVDLNDSSGIKTGTKLYFGPSTDADNIGASEMAVVSHVGQVSSGLRVYLTAPLTYQYTVGDKVTFYKFVYLFSHHGYGNDPNKGALYKFDAYNWQLVEVDTKAIYKKVSASRWCPSVRGIASIMNSTMLFIRPYDSYQNWRSFFLDNFTENKVDTYNVVDVIFDGNTIYRLQNAITLRSDGGAINTTIWTTYNYQQDSLLPYNNSMSVWMQQSLVTGHTKDISINVNVKDQYFVGLRDVEVQFSKASGDPNSNFVPLSGRATSDVNGNAIIGYVSGFNYYGHTSILASATGGSASKGSEYVWSSNNVVSYPDFPVVNYKIFQIKYSLNTGAKYVRQLDSPFKFYTKDQNGIIVSMLPNANLFQKSYYTAPGGDWLPKEHPDASNVNDVAQWLPTLYRGDNQNDAPRELNRNNSAFSNWPYPDILSDTPPTEFPIPNQIRLLSNFESEAKIRALSVFLIYDSLAVPLEEGRLPDLVIIQPDESFDLQVSQLKLGKHSHWVDGVHQTELWTYVNVNQFVFVEDANPQFFSEKNPIETNIWIRLRPYAFSLDNNTLKMWVREVSYAGDTGYVEVTTSLQLTNFDAGGGTLGIEVLYNPPEDFHYNALVFVRIEVYDEAYIPNFVYVEYWFNTIPDYSAPYLTNLHPDREQNNVFVDTSISFEIIEVGTGLDMSSLECLLNSRLMDPNHLVVEELSDHHLRVTYTPPQSLYFDKEYKVTVKIQDTSPAQNKVVDSWRFYTAESSGLIFTDFYPDRCKRGMARFSDVRVTILAGGDGIDKDSIRMQIYDKDVQHRLIPIVYRIS